MAKTAPAPARAGFFYGWVVVAVMASAGALTMALGTLNFGLFVKPMGDDLGIGRSVFGWAQAVRQIASALTGPALGNLLDRVGARVLLAFAALVTGLALIGLAGISNGWQMIALFAVMGVVGMSGPGAIVTSVPVTKWFVRRRGTALAFTSLGVPVGALVFMPLTQIFIDSLGWRLAWVGLAILGAGLIIPLSLIFVRRQPEDLGLLPDGERAAPVGHPIAHPPVDERSWTRAEAMGSSAFWRLVVVFSLVMLAISFVGVHRIPSFMDRGLDPRLISYATALDAAASGLSTFSMGLLSRSVAPRFVGSFGFGCLAVASVLTVIADNHPVMFASMIIFGLGIGVLSLMQNLIWAEYFGRQHLGSIRGAVMPITLLCSAVGAPVAGYVYEATGSYTQIWLAATGLMVIGAVLLGLTPSPQRDPVPVVDAAQV